MLGIDPGSSKTGLALLTCSGEIIRRRIALTTNFEAELVSFLAGVLPRVCIIGNGTRSKEHQKRLMECWPQCTIIELDEAYSTEEARKLYWQLNPPTSWRKFLPLGLLKPPVALDDYAAVILVRRYLEQTT
ncbi:MAG TPA: pre-16S rRNA-processing nuclease YqgF [Candidatus Avacidaminococcus intestinavium]|uniref:Pre-16S rRNA-processing nuclease YqgF n=1 Tax=Candidatus Avacidaminococcus intestinavium TaxID=2840684 RepID=A0A9D1MNV7_9FIRM|nr:pre-16S rRNA-processing nuclease YqgF [Candidatus Avacidaminococcus intestinavium]